MTGSAAGVLGWFARFRGRPVKFTCPYPAEECPFVLIPLALGAHTRVTTTERYTHVAAAQVRDAGERMGAVLWGDG